MTAKEQALKYAAEHNNGTMTDAEVFGQMLTEGYVIARTPNTKTVANARREGKEIIVSETVIAKVQVVESGKLIEKVTETTAEIFRATI